MRLEARDLCGERGGERVFGPLSFALSGSESLVVTGPNGAGKSTLLRVVGGLLPTAGGSVRLVESERWPSLGDACHFLGPGNAMKAALTVGENLSFWRTFLREPLLSVDEALEALGLGAIGPLPFGVLSTGQQRRAAAARLLVSFRPIWLLDEPTAGLDRAAEARFAELMKAHLTRGGMILAATHQPLGLDGSPGLSLGAAGTTDPC